MHNKEKIVLKKMNYQLLIVKLCLIFTQRNMQFQRIFGFTHKFKSFLNNFILSSGLRN